MAFRGFNSINEWQNAISPLVDDYKNLRYDYDAKDAEINQLNLAAYNFRMANKEAFDKFRDAHNKSEELYRKLISDGIDAYSIQTDPSHGWIAARAERDNLAILSENHPDYESIKAGRVNAIKEKTAIDIKAKEVARSIESVGDRINVSGGYESSGRKSDFEMEFDKQLSEINTKKQEIKQEYERVTGEPYDKMSKASPASSVAIRALAELQERERVLWAFRKSQPKQLAPRTDPTPSNIDKMDSQIEAMNNEIAELEKIWLSGNKYDQHLIRLIASGVRTDVGILSARRDAVVTEFQKLPQKPSISGQPSKTYKTKAQVTASGGATKTKAIPVYGKLKITPLPRGQKPDTEIELPEASIDPVLDPQDAVLDMPLPESDVQPATQDQPEQPQTYDDIDSQLRDINEQRAALIKDYEAATGQRYTGTLKGEEASAYVPLLRELQEKERILWASRRAVSGQFELHDADDIQPSQEDAPVADIIEPTPQPVQRGAAEQNVILDEQTFTDPRKLYADRLSPERLASIEEAFSSIATLKGFLSSQNIDYSEQDIQVGGINAEPSGGELLLRDQVVIDYQPPPSQGGITIEPELTLRPTGFTVTREKQPKLKLPRGATYMAEPDYFEQVPGFKLPQGQSTQSAATPVKPDESYIKPGLATVEGRVENLIRTDNPLTQAAAAAAERKYQAKGLLQSSGAVQAGVGAAMEQAVQIATPDAALYGGLAQQRQRTDLETSVNNQLAEIERKKFENNALITASLSSQDISGKKELQTLADTAAKERIQLENEWKDYLSQSQYDTAETQALMQSAGAMGQELTGSIERLLRDTNIVNKQDAIAALMAQYKAQLNTVAATAGITLEWD